MGIQLKGIKCIALKFFQMDKSIEPGEELFIDPDDALKMADRGYVKLADPKNKKGGKYGGTN